MKYTIISNRNWDMDDWRTRKEMLQQCWEWEDEDIAKSLIADMLMHAPDVSNMSE